MILKILLLSVLSWMFGLTAILIASYFLYETPHIKDVIGFGGLLLIGCSVLITVYILILKKIRLHISTDKRVFIMPLVLSAVVNIPVYILLWIGSGQVFGAGEPLLFSIGFMMVALFFGAGYALFIKQVT